MGIALETYNSHTWNILFSYSDTLSFSLDLASNISDYSTNMSKNYRNLHCCSLLKRNHRHGNPGSELGRVLYSNQYFSFFSPILPIYSPLSALPVLGNPLLPLGCSWTLLLEYCPQKSWRARYKFNRLMSHITNRLFKNLIQHGIRVCLKRITIWDWMYAYTILSGFQRIL